ncbi:hypothetical protein J4E08_06005 [Sagittula sp. NFXS13]|uniref:DUF6455 family protein n=1 Tax=Sagittula sp. NFXS13 TaxID=2819095 RepID=UPI0032DF9E69
MQSPAVLKKHAELVDRMATAQGIDLEEQMMRGRVTTPDLADAVLRCTGCSNPEHCRSWLASQQRVAQGTPDYCRNTEMLDDLRKALDHG